jgi:uncharacterized protein (TIGR02284 family)
MEKEKTKAVLNLLITINNDRIEGYETASKETEEIDLKILFAQFISTSLKCKQELSIEVQVLGGKPAEGTLTSGKFFRVWMDFKVALTSKVRNAVLNSCAFGENKALDTYDKVLEYQLEHLSQTQQNMIITQKSMIKADYNYVKSMCNAMMA